MLNFVELFKIILSIYPQSKELTRDRLVKLTYLADWRSAITYKKQITSVKWYINNYGPYIEDMYKILADEKFDINQEIQRRKTEKYNCDREINLVVNFIIDKTQDLDSNTFSNLVFSTFPLATSTKYSYVDLVEKAKQYLSEEK